MRIRLSIKRIFIGIFAATVLLAGLTVLALFRVTSLQEELKHANESRYQSYLLADELHQSSDDLTRLARTYVVTGDAKYERQYQDILDIRNGSKPRPPNYDRIFWDFVATGTMAVPTSGQQVSLSELMRQAGFSSREFAKLKEAEANSNELVKTEVIAMNAVKGLFEDGKGGYSRREQPDPELARRIMHDAAYHRNKARIMQPLNEFLALLDERTKGEVERAEHASKTAFWWAGILLLLTVVVSVVSLVLVYRYVKAGLDTAITAANHIAGGDLSRDIDTSRSDEIGEVLAAMGRINNQVAEIIGDIRSSTEQMAVATGEIAVGNSDLSGRTESQASSLEQTASAMETLTETVQQNAHNATTANQLAGEAFQEAGQGGEVVAQVVLTMGVIKDSSARIADIIGVIDGIAFQTNILALNAAVEAARAGEQGRGFAVVAAEVRNLAQRSAAAAKEIKELIGASVCSVDEGARLADVAGATITRLVGSVQKVASIMGDISAAGREQSTGIGEVNQAISQMDAITQQNAALVEQAAAAAESLREQADGLLNAVGRFRLKSAPAAKPAGSGFAAPVRQAPKAPPARAAKAPVRRIPPPVKGGSSAGADAGDWVEF